MDVLTISNLEILIAHPKLFVHLVCIHTDLYNNPKHQQPTIKAIKTNIQFWGNYSCHNFFQAAKIGTFNNL